ncbi:DsbA family protein, partial [Bacillus sp. HC-TM]
PENKIIGPVVAKNDEIYQNQKKDTEEWITEDLLLSIVKEKLPKVNVEQFKKDLHSKDIKEKVSKDSDRAQKLKVQGAPSVIHSSVSFF